MDREFNPAIFIIIRFAMVTKFSNRLFNDRDSAKDWLAKRIPIFHRVCLPGLEIQSKKPDAVLVGLVEGLDAQAEEIIGAASEGLRMWPSFQLSTKYKSQEIMDSFRKSMSGIVNEAHTHIITIRLDNDDAIHKNYVEYIVKHFSQKFSLNPDRRDFFTSFIFGMQTNGSDFRTYLYPNGPFQARMEKIDEKGSPNSIKGVYAINHTKIFDGYNASILVRQNPSWIQFIHGDNVSNSIKGSSLRLTNLDALLGDFGINRSSFLPLGGN